MGAEVPQADGAQPAYITYCLISADGSSQISVAPLPERLRDGEVGKREVKTSQ